MASRELHLFDAIGIELEYMIVDRRQLNVLPVCDQVLKAHAGSFVSEVDFDDGIGWSNELTLHVIELKTSEPVPTLAGLAGRFDEHVQRIHTLLQPLGGRLMPGAVHPWMDPFAEMKLWPHAHNAVYAAFNRIFDCRGHGWANLQSMHINLPFHGDAEFGRLHAAIRLLLPLLPGLAASSPVVDAKPTGLMDNRLEAYRHHCDRLPVLIGSVIPEPIYTIGDYQGGLLQRLYDALDPLDPDDILNGEWVNARGAIARFDRGAIEIRVIDLQETPAADLAVAAAAVAVLKSLCEEHWCDLDEMQRVPVQPLADLLVRAIREGDQAVCDDAQILQCFGYDRGPLTLNQMWRGLVDHHMRKGSPELTAAADELTILLDEGPLARRLLRSLGDNPDRSDVQRTWESLCNALRESRMFKP